ncbi:MAG TPA: hypothetical protein VFX50_05955, partial [Gemmatimonadales bacterium]|nr:hypothetical protein [Gemmatimonadales bacterium]
MRRLLLAVLALAACDRADRGAAPAADGATTPGASVVRDSAGVTLVESAAPAWGARTPWRLEAAPL